MVRVGSLRFLGELNVVVGGGGEVVSSVVIITSVVVGLHSFFLPFLLSVSVCSFDLIALLFAVSFCSLFVFKYFTLRMYLFLCPSVYLCQALSYPFLLPLRIPFVICIISIIDLTYK